MTRPADHRVADAMTYRPVTIGRQAPLAEAARVFEQLHVGSLPVTEDGCLVGILTRLDMLKAFAAGQDGGGEGDVMAIPAEAVMTRAPVTLAPTASLADALETMIVTRCPHVAVVFGALLVGIITRTDVARALQATRAGGALGRVA